MREGTTVIVVGGIALGAVVLFSVVKAANQRALMAQRAAIAQQPSGSTVNDIMAGVSVGSSVFSEIAGLFSNWGGSNDPGFVESDSSYNDPGLVDSYGGSNDPGLDTYDDL